MNIEQVEAVVDTTRQLARIVKVDDVIPHPNADRMSLATIGGWQCCIKLNEFKKGDLALYIEIDSLVPISHPTFAFLEDRKESLKVVNEVLYSRIKSIRLRKELSQGILLQIPSEFVKDAEEHDDLTDALGVLKKAEKAVKADSNINEETRLGKLARWISGPARTNLKPWPHFLNKSEQPRLQNLGGRYNTWLEQGIKWQRSVKLNGQSVTFFVHAGETGVCSRNNEVSLIDDLWDWKTQARYWLGQLLVTNRRMFRKREWVFPERLENMGLKEWLQEFRNKNQHNRLLTIPTWKKGIFAKDDHVSNFAIQSGTMKTLIDWTKKHGGGWAVQGELIGPGIQSNFEGVKELTFYAYKISVIEDGVDFAAGDLTPEMAVSVASEMGVNHIPVLESEATLPPSIKGLLLSVEKPKHLTGKGNCEGEVWKSVDGVLSFKAISNKYLIAEEEVEG